MKNVGKGLEMAAGIVLLGGSVFLRAQSKPTSQAPKASAHHSQPKTAGVPSNDKIIRFMRDKFGITEKVSIALDPFHASANPNYLEANLTVDDGQNTKTSKRTSNLDVSKDGHYLVVSYLPVTSDGNGAFLSIQDKSNDDIARRIHDAFRFPPTISVTVGESQSSKIPGFLETMITLDDGKNKSKPDAYITRDHHYIILGNIYDLGVDPKREALRRLVLQNQPETGTKNAPVTIVEFADLECPTCARAHEFLEKDLLPKYGGKIRLIFKEFPLPMHEWALPEAIANQCAYRINPADYEAYRTLLFQHQSEFEAVKGDASKVRDMLIDYGQQAGLDHLQLAGCIDSKASLPRVEANVKEGKAINVNSTPSFFINGKIQIGADPQVFYQNVDEALQAAKKR